MKQDTRSQDAKEAHEAFERVFWNSEPKKGLYVSARDGLVPVKSVWAGIEFLSKEKTRADPL